MICLDTNIIIYLGNGTLSDTIIGDTPLCYASITAIEALGYPVILSAEEQRIGELLATMMEMALSPAIIQAAIRLRQLRKMSLGDAIVAATAIEHQAVLWTANTDDFTGIDRLTLYNPLARQ